MTYRIPAARTLRILPLLALLWLIPVPAAEAASEQRRIEAARTKTPPTIDGRLDDAVWSTVEPFTGLTQREPRQGEAPSQRTEIRVLYDDNAIYIGARMFDSAPDSIVARLGRRDTFDNSDRFAFFIDPYFDRTTGYFFSVNAAGTLADGILYNDSWEDTSWDGVWQARVRIDEHGWTAEMRIPLSQIRFRTKKAQTWGVNFRRDITRTNEQLFLVYTPRNESGFVSRFIPMTGVENVRAPRRIEALPYITKKAAYLDAAAGDPFRAKNQYTPALGFDAKVGVGSSLTLDLTVNPDFGQVEVDPAVVNLSDVESFFQERRPFFVEGSNIFNFGVGGARNYWGFNWPSVDLFYSRRIGRAPRGSLPHNDFADVPDGTRILGAAKLTGRLGNGTSIGVISAVTAREHARISVEGDRALAEIEPMAFSGVYRLRHEIRDGFRSIGAMSTVNARSFSDDRLRSQMGSGSVVAGVDGWSFLDDDRTWVMTGALSASTVHGSTAYITALQQSPVHYFQRPDADHVSVDPDATALAGLAGRAYLAKQRGRYFVNAAAGFVSPGFNSNDLGFLSRTDVINAHFGAGRSWMEPVGIRRAMELGGAVYANRDFQGNTTGAGLFHFGFVQFANYHSLNWNLGASPEVVNNRRTRGGPLTLNPAILNANFNWRSDGRKTVAYGLGMSGTGANHYREASVNTSVSWRPASNVSLSAGPALSLVRQEAQWVGSRADDLADHTYGRRYIFATMDHTTLSANIRLNWTFSPQVTLQLFAQPLLSAGNYDGFKELAAPKTFRFIRYDHIEETEHGYRIDPDGNGPASPFQINRPDFNFLSLRGNAVFRWEYRPGSTLFLVWTQSRADSIDDGSLNFGRSLDRLWDARADNIFMLKLNFWLSM
jgi:hypothetical protein